MSSNELTVHKGELLEMIFNDVVVYSSCSTGYAIIIIYYYIINHLVDAIIIIYY